MQYLEIPEVRISIYIVIILVLTLILNWYIRRLFTHKTETSDFFKNNPNTKVSFLKNTISVLLWLLAILAIIFLIPPLKTYALSLFAGAGILLAVIGFAAQHAFSNIISGFFILIFKPFQIGDRIKVGELSYGFVEDITMRHTIIVNFENKRIVIPNSIMSTETIINDDIQDSIICRFVEIGVAYDADIDRACQVLREVCEAHPNTIDQRKSPDQDIVEVRLIQFADSAILLRALVWTNQPHLANLIHSQINFELLRRYREENIEIPFPQRTLHIKASEIPGKI